MPAPVISLRFFCCLCLYSLFLSCGSISTLVSLDNGICQLGNDQLYGTDRIIISGDHIVKLFRIAVCISNTYKRNTQCLCFLDADVLLSRIYYEDHIRQLLHFLNTADILLQLLHLFLDLYNFLLGKYIEGSVCFHLLILLQSLNTGLDGLEVCQHTTQPSLVNEVHTAALSLCLDRILCLLLCTYKEDLAALSNSIKYCLVSLVHLYNGLLKIDDVDPVSLCVDVLRHLGVPTSCLVSEMNTCLE